MFLEFFPKHRRVSGTISIMLTLLLLPIYSVLSIIIEGARYQSAKQQLDELTYLGQLAILADYMDFLEENYDLYSFYSASDAEGKQMLDESFQYYVESATSAGGIDTTKLNKLFNLPMDCCTVEGMYSLADPEILKYQIKQYGKYRMPADILSDFSFKMIFDLLESKLGGVAKKLSVVNAASKQMKDASSIMNNAKAVFSAEESLTSNISTFSGKYDEFQTKKSEVTDWNIDQATYDIIKNYTDADMNAQTNTANNLYSRLKSCMSSYQSTANTYLNYVEQIKDIESQSNWSSDSAKVAEHDSLIESRDNVKVTISGSDEGFLGLSGEVACSDLIGVFFNKCNECITNGAFSDFDLDTQSGYSTVISNLGDAISEIQTRAAKYENLKKIRAAFEAHNTMTDYGHTTLYDSYNDYITKLKAVTTDLSNIVDNVYTMQAAQQAMDIDDLNNKGREAAMKEEEYREALENESEQTILNLKSEQRELAQKRKEAYAKAKADKNYMKLGSNIAEKFISEVVVSGKLDKWITNYTKAPAYNSPVLSTPDDYNEFVAACSTAQNYSGERVPIHKFDMSAVMPDDLSSDDTENMQEKIEKLMDEAEKNKSEGSSDDSGSDTYTESEEGVDTSNNLSESELDKAFSKIMNGDDDFIEEEWFPSDENKSYYLDQPQIMILLAFLGGTAVAEGELDKGILDLIKMLLEAFKKLSPADCGLDSHVGGAGLGNLGEKSSIFPSHSYINGLRDVNTHNATRNTALEYAQENLGGSGNSLGIQLSDASDSFYVQNGYNQIDSVIDVFGQLQPGTSIAALMNASGKAFGAIDSFMKNVVTLNIIGIIFSLWDFVQGIIGFVEALIDFVIDIIAVIGLFHDGANSFFIYLLDQIYLGYYIQEHFHSRQTTTEIAEYSFNPGCDYNGATGDDCQEASMFKAAQMEYIMIGDNCEISNQRNTFYAILGLRVLLNYSMIDNHYALRNLKAIPYVGFLMPFLVDYFDSKVDLMFMLMGYKVPLVKDDIMIVTLAKEFKNKKKREELFSIIKSALVDDLSSNTRNERKKNNRFVWTMETDKDTGKQYRKYKDKPELPEGKFKGMLEEGSGLDSDSKMIEHTDDGKWIVRLDYETTLNVILFFYPADMKAVRIADLIQMEGMHKADKGTGDAYQDFITDSGFRLKDCYTYVNTKIEANFTPLMPTLAEGQIFDNSKFNNVQMNGY